MTTLTRTEPGTVTASRQELVRLVEKINAQAGVVRAPNMSIAKLQELMQADGVRPADNGASREPMRMRYGDDWDKE